MPSYENGSEYVTEAEIEQDTEHWAKLFAAAFYDLEEETENGRLQDMDRSVDELYTDRERIVNTVVDDQLPLGYRHELAQELAAWRADDLETHVGVSVQDEATRSIAAVYEIELMDGMQQEGQE